MQSRISYILGVPYGGNNGQPKGLLPPRLYSLMFYRKDVFLSGNVTSAPQSWDQLLIALQQVNGRLSRVQGEVYGYKVFGRPSGVNGQVAGMIHRL